MKLRENEFGDIKRAKVITVLGILFFVVALFLEIAMIIKFASTTDFTYFVFMILILWIIPVSINNAFCFSRVRRHNKSISEKKAKEREAAEIEERRLQSVLESVAKASAAATTATLANAGALVKQDEYVCPYCNTIMSADEKSCPCCGSRRKAKK